ncbi:unnamed protein product [Paramecium octaurelia]|uniref:Transmembrane protein n=1 Tax=Paramecium octaurelia TaxID=43137 RepID=A0A8S1VQB2_PAROT|nr:unnamed protein product [Paramecium octaurelia]
MQIVMESTELTFTFLIILTPVFIEYENLDQSESKQHLWNAGGLNEDLIYIVLINAFQIMIFSIIDFQYAWQLYDLFNTNIQIRIQLQHNLKLTKQLKKNKLQ